MKRKIAAILAADIAGFSKLVAEDEEGALARLVESRDHFVTTIDQFGGRVFNEAGDSILAEFASAVDALRCAVEVQQHFRLLARDEPSESRMLYRIGLTIGDVVERDGNLLGDAVNVAARLEALAKPGGICVSRSVHEHVSGKIAVRFISLGEQKLKNIPTRQHAFEVILPQKKPDKADAAARRLDPMPIELDSGGGPPTALTRIAAGLVVAAGLGLAAWALPWSSLGSLFGKPQPTAPIAAVGTPAAKPAATAAASDRSKVATAIQQPVETKSEAPAASVRAGPSSDQPEPEAKVVSTAPPAKASPGECSTFLPQTRTTISVPCPDAPSGAVSAQAAPLPARPADAPVSAPPSPAAVVIALPTRRPADLAARVTPAVVQPAIATPAEPARTETTRSAPRRKDQLCADILERAQLGELSLDDKEFLQRECR